MLTRTPSLAVSLHRLEANLKPFSLKNVREFKVREPVIAATRLIKSCLQRFTILNTQGVHDPAESAPARLPDWPCV
jgi:hypothetical protein